MNFQIDSSRDAESRIQPLASSGDELTGGLFSQNPSFRQYFLRWVLFITITSAIAISVGTAWGGSFTSSDSEWYLKIANGETATVLQPFALRQLGPLVCEALVSVLHVNIYSAFIIEGVFSILVVIGIVGFLLLSIRANIFFLVAVGGLSLWAILFNQPTLPDLWYAALLAFFLVLLKRERFLACALMLFPLFLSRESTILVLFCFVIAGWRRMRWSHYALAAIASCAGVLTVKLLTAGGPSNREHMSQLLYLVGKVPWNLMKNVVGIPLWNNLNTGNCALPHWLIGLHLGGVTSVGLCQYTPSYTLLTLLDLLGNFGLLPLLFIYICWKNWRLTRTEGAMIRFCILYGTISFLLAPMLGASVSRLVDYAWPLFAVAVPTMGIRYISIPRLPAVALLGLHLAVAWFVTLTNPNTFGLLVVSDLLLAIAYAGGWVLLRRGTVTLPGVVLAAER